MSSSPSAIEELPCRGSKSFSCFGVVTWRGGCQNSGIVPVTRSRLKIMRSVANSPRAASMNKPPELII
ncbi:hypothetical protein TNCV_4537571 [Trichonephila clavipes]|nr:hypothetical protein TNCV_4537571 [Trichonephila clavipes]